MKRGLVLEGGAMRGLFTAGVLDVFLENGIMFDATIGVSAGAAFGCNYKSKQIGRALRYNMNYCNDPRYCSIRSLIKTGDIFGADFCYRQIPKKLDIFDDDAYNKNPMQFYVVATDMNSGKALYRELPVSDENCLDWIRASASMPLVSRPVKVDGYELLDGGIADSIPLEYFQKLGFNKNIVVLTRPYSYKKAPNKLLFILRHKYKKYPNLYKTMAQRHIVYNKTVDYINECEKKGEVFVIRPSQKLKVGKIEHNPEVLKSIYECGRKQALENLEKIKAFLK